ncbi:MULTISPECIES: DUF1659 domain-containing protein [Pontibacillus]|uniref:DUF1659 domain-containing protein n=1 Tax=Pontibacillus chungwhensis TaxID=265426 RepID=A0ABY8V115_9BACI|nr:MULTISPECIES: DUF1659 domain-containing protein [Pontibacillus]MCD5324368.1 DUF1659 domain-containing protein [Pontibacillus sp. HN14]WIF99333.1 DUF1659 domain-containing protein [Pontibacillus chungwhensis]
MAITNKMKSQLQIVLEDGLDEEGNMTFKNKNFNNVKTDATADQLFAVASALVPLQQRSLAGIERNDSSLIIGA